MIVKHTSMPSIKNLKTQITSLKTPIEIPPSTINNRMFNKRETICGYRILEMLKSTMQF
uniref:Bm13289 n=1 Tax=Brugia malayi TaxID=6279 RepID=A0A0J9XZG5_BRUMA|nr:Bm13289 [Brugia malayi]